MTSNENNRPKLTENERARLQAFKNVQERKKERQKLKLSENTKTIYQDSNNVSEKEKKDVKKNTMFSHLNKDSFIVSAFLVTLGLVGYWYIRANFNEIFIYFIIFGGLLKIILVLLGKDND